MGARRKTSKSRKRQAGKRVPRGRWTEPEEPDLLADIRRAISDPNPVTLIEYVSSLMLVVDPRRKNPFEPDQPDGMTLAELVDMFIGVPNPETSALLAVVGEMAADDVLRARIRRELATRPIVRPSWLEHLWKVEAHRAARMHHVLGDGDNIIIGVRMTDGREFTCAVYIDHNAGTLVKDAFVLPEPIAGVLAKYQQLTDDPDTRWDDIDRSDARVWIEEAVGRAAITYPPFESETWPGCRALVEWIVRGMPGGGAEYPRPQWSESNVDALAERFFASPHGRPLDDRDHRDLLESLLWYGTDYGSGDPTRWSAVRVEILLDDWIPRKIVASVEHLAKAPELLRAFIRFVHAEVEIRPNLTDEVIAAVDQWEPVYQTTIRTPRLQGAEAILGAMGMARDESGDGFYDDEDIAGWGLERLERQVRGRQRLAELDVVPLPDEPFRWDEIPDDIVTRVQDVIKLVDACCDEMFDIELRTACRRLTARVASVGPDVFRRAKRIDNTAAAVVWIVSKVNNALGLYYGVNGPQVQEMTAYFGIKGSASQKASALLDAGGFDSRTYDLTLGSPDFLVAARRSAIIESRDQYEAMLDRA